MSFSGAGTPKKRQSTVTMRLSKRSRKTAIRRKYSMPKVLNKRDSGLPKGAIYVGRPSKWGNPFRAGFDGTRAEVIARYESHLNESGLINDIAELRGKDLVCWCTPKRCHADVLLRLANE